MPLIQPTHSLGSSRDKTPTNPKPRFRRNPYLPRCRSSWQIRWGEGTTPRGE